MREHLNSCTQVIKSKNITFSHSLIYTLYIQLSHFQCNFFPQYPNLTHAVSPSEC